MIYIRKSDGYSYTVDATNCDGSTASIITSSSCTVPISTLTAGAFVLPWGSSIYAKVIAYNVYGDSDESLPGNGAIILTNPDAPVTLVETVASRAATAITFSWTKGAANGGATVLDYRISSDQSIGDWTILASGVMNTYYTATGLTPGNTYEFKVEARNSYGYSAYSTMNSILCATLPSTPVAPVTSVVASNVIVTLTPPTDNGLAITSYTVYLLNSAGVWAQELTYCDGTDLTIVSSASCTIPLDTLTASTFSLNLGDDVLAKFLATNAYGSSGTSVQGNGALIVLIPDAPLTLTDDPTITLED
jgi:hypothetical protein